MSSASTLDKRLRTLHRRLYPSPKPELWLPTGVLLDENGDYLPGHQAIAERCEKLGIIPNVYIVSDEWHPDMDGCEL